MKSEKLVLENEHNLEETPSLDSLLSSLPNLDKVQLLLCLEGSNDVSFFKNISHLFDVDLENDDRIAVLGLGGSTLIRSLNQNYLKKLNKKEVHIYDRDADSKYQKEVDIINNRSKAGHFATLTQKREIENYFHESIILEYFNEFDRNKGDESHQIEIDFVINDTDDIPELIARIRHEARIKRPWVEEDNKNYRDRCKKFVKKHLNHSVSLLITKELLKERNALEEVEGWFDEIKKRLK